MTIELVGKIGSYCKTELPMNQATQGIVLNLAKDILQNSSNLTTPAKYEWIQDVSVVLNDKKNNAVRVDALKKALCGNGRTNWKEGVLNTFQDDKFNLKAIFLDFSNSLSTPIQRDKRARFYYSKEAFSACIGSTFMTNKPRRLLDGGDNILDTAYGCVCYDEHKTFQGYAMALGDGSGGHFGDLKQDERIIRAAHFATKSCVRLFSAYHDADMLQRELKPVLKLVEKEIKQKALGESTTLVACRAIPTNNGFRIIGLAVGTCILAAWHPSTKKAHPLISSHETEAGSALIPESFKPFELQTIDATVPEGSFLFLMSDGAHNSLSYRETQSTYSNGLRYRERSLKDLEVVLGAIPLEASSNRYLEILVKEVFNHAEQERMRQTQADIQIGDDFAILQCQLLKSNNGWCTIS